MNCPNCKNPVQRNSAACEWCDFQFQIDINVNPEVLNLVKDGNLLAAVKSYQKISGLSLYESKTYVDLLVDSIKGNS